MKLLAALRLPLLLMTAAAAVAIGIDPRRSTPAGGGVRELVPGTAIPDAVERVTPAVVSIYSTRTPPRSAVAVDPPGLFGGGSPRTEQGLGSGVIVRADGIIVTNHHVVDGATELRVVLTDRRELRARVVGRDPHTDVALLRIDADELPTVPFGDSSEVRVGDTVLAIGNSLGMGQTVSCGIVSAKGRANVGIVDDEDFLQTDAAINPGNSGGPLVNLDGEVIGINTAIATRTGGFQGVGFAIPSRMVVEIMEILLREGRVSRGQLGVVLQDLTPALVSAFQDGPDRGAIVAEAPEKGAAREAGIHCGDIIVMLDGKAVESTADLRHRIAMRGGGAKVRLQVWRDFKLLDFTVRLKELGDPSGAVPEESSAEEDPEGAPSGLSGISVGAVTPEMLRRVGVRDEEGGVIVTSVQPGSTVTGLRRGDLIVEVGRKSVRSISELRDAVRHSGDPALLRVRRQEGSLYLSVPK